MNFLDKLATIKDIPDNHLLVTLGMTDLYTNMTTQSGFLVTFWTLFLSSKFPLE